jgi:hypothetical protein
MVNIEKTDGKDPPFSMGKSTFFISTGPFSSSQTVGLPEGMWIYTIG